MCVHVCMYVCIHTYIHTYTHNRALASPDGAFICNRGHAHIPLVLHHRRLLHLSESLHTVYLDVLADLALLNVKLLHIRPDVASKSVGSDQPMKSGCVLISYVIVCAAQHLPGYSG